MQLMLVAVVIFWPESVTYWLDKEVKVNTDDVKIEMKIEDTAEPDTANAVSSGASETRPGQPGSPSADEADANSTLAVPAPDVPAPDDDPAKAVKDALKAASAP
jgi:hypothetical protein